MTQLKDKDIEGLKSCLEVFFGIGLILPTYLLLGLVLADLWRWFAVPLGAPQIGVLVITGLVLLYQTFMSKADGKPAHPDYKVHLYYAQRVSTLLMAWGLGFILHRLSL